MRPGSILRLVLVAFIAMAGCVPETDLAGCLRDCNYDMSVCVVGAESVCRKCQRDAATGEEFYECAPGCLRDNVDCLNGCLECIAACAKEVEDQL